MEHLRHGHTQLPHHLPRLRRRILRHCRRQHTALRHHTHCHRLHHLLRRMDSLLYLQVVRVTCARGPDVTRFRRRCRHHWRHRGGVDRGRRQRGRVLERDGGEEGPPTPRSRCGPAQEVRAARRLQARSLCRHLHLRPWLESPLPVWGGRGALGANEADAPRVQAAQAAGAHAL